jgi:hypothetical protein
MLPNGSELAQSRLEESANTPIETTDFNPPQEQPAQLID